MKNCPNCALKKLQKKKFLVYLSVSEITKHGAKTLYRPMTYGSLPFHLVGAVA